MLILLVFVTAGWNAVGQSQLEVLFTNQVVTFTNLEGVVVDKRKSHPSHE